MLCVVSVVRIVNKYHMSLIDPRNGIVLWTEPDDHGAELQWSSVGARRH